jgi:hypothetical protein
VSLGLLSPPLSPLSVTGISKAKNIFIKSQYEMLKLTLRLMNLTPQSKDIFIKSQYEMLKLSI